MTRQTGRTTEQIKGAPRCAIFVWCNDAISYAQHLCRQCGRDDIQVKPMSALVNRMQFMGIDLIVVFDHAVEWRPAYDAAYLVIADRNMRLEAAEKKKATA